MGDFKISNGKEKKKIILKSKKNYFQIKVDKKENLKKSRKKKREKRKRKNNYR